MGSEKKTMLCFDALNWMSSIFWNDNADLQYCEDPWEALRYSDRTVNTFVKAARNADFELVVVVAGRAKDADAIAKYECRRQLEIQREKRGVCLRADSFLAESFQTHGVRVLRPMDADTTDVLAAFADSVEGAVIVSRNHLFFCYDKPLLVSRSFTVKGGKLILEPPVTRNDADLPANRRKRLLTVQPHLALPHETWSVGLVAKYRPSLRSQRLVDLGSSSSSDRRKGSLHAIARPLRAAVYASLGEQVVLERIPEWCNDEKVVVWTETEVVADPGLTSILQDPLSVVEWLEKHDTAVAQLEPWRDADRLFNICCLAAELVTVSSNGNMTMHKCMEILSNNADIISRTSLRAKTSAEQEGGPHTFPNARRRFAEPIKTESAQQHQSSPPNLLPKIAKKENTSPSSNSRVSIFGTGRPREEVLQERGKQDVQQ